MKDAVELFTDKIYKEVYHFGHVIKPGDNDLYLEVSMFDIRFNNSKRNRFHVHKVDRNDEIYIIDIIPNQYKSDDPRETPMIKQDIIYHSIQIGSKLVIETALSPSRIKFKGIVSNTDNYTGEGGHKHLRINKKDSEISGSDSNIFTTTQSKDMILKIKNSSYNSEKNN